MPKNLVSCCKKANSYKLDNNIINKLKTFQETLKFLNEKEIPTFIFFGQSSGGLISDYHFKKNDIYKKKNFVDSVGTLNPKTTF